MASAPRVVDTSAWIEWLIGGALGACLGIEFPGKDSCLVPTTYCTRAFMPMRRPVPVELTSISVAYWMSLPVTVLPEASFADAGATDVTVPW